MYCVNNHVIGSDQAPTKVEKYNVWELRCWKTQKANEIYLIFTLLTLLPSWNIQNWKKLGKTSFIFPYFLWLGPKSFIKLILGSWIPFFTNCAIGTASKYRFKWQAHKPEVVNKHKTGYRHTQLICSGTRSELHWLPPFWRSAISNSTIYNLLLSR